MPIPSILTSPAIEEAMKDMASCPFCGSRQGLEGMRFVRITYRSRMGKFYYVDCWLCGARGAWQAEPLDAIESWNKREGKVWTPLGDVTVQLPNGQKFSHLMVEDGGRTVSLIDYIEEEISAEKDGIAAKIEIKLGEFRVSKKR